MKNELYNNPFTSRLTNVFLLTLLFCHIILFLLSWLSSATGWPLRNLFTTEGIRWFFLHIKDSLCSPAFAVILPILLTLGAFHRSGFSSIIIELLKRNKTSSTITYRKRKALWMACLFFVFYMLFFIAFIIRREPILLSVTGHVYPSPFLRGFLQITTIGLTITAAIYSNLSNHLHGVNEYISVFYWGIQRYALWIFVTILGTQFYNFLCYVFSDFGGIHLFH